MNFKKHDFSCSDSGDGFSPSSIKLDLLFDGSSISLQQREKSYKKTINYSL